jgi:hypothetical protein
MRLLVGLVLGAAGIGWGTRCDPRGLGPLCGQFPQEAILFSGTVKENGPREQGRWSRFAVQEIFQGLPTGTTEVIVFPDTWGGFTVGQSYFLTVGTWINFNSRPWTWERFKWWWNVDRHLPTGLRLQSGYCAYSREQFRVPKEDWAYARAIRAGTHRRRIYGRVSAVGRLWPGSNGWPRIPDATVRIHGKSKSWSVMTDANGAYSIDNVEPGQYWVEAEKLDYTSIGPTPELEVSANGCGYGPLALTAAGKIAGRVVRPDGSAAAGATVSYQFAEPTWRGAIESTTASEKGEFVFDDAPPGNLLLKARPADSDEPYTAMPVPLRLNQVRQRIVFRLNPTPPKRVLTVRVRWPDGRLASGVEVHGHTDWTFTGRRTTGADGTAQLSLFSGHPYSVFASVQVDGQWAGAGAHVKPETSSVDLVIVKAPSQSR